MHSQSLASKGIVWRSKRKLAEMQTGTWEIITCADDGRIDDLVRLLSSVKTFAPAVRIRIIPFTDSIPSKVHKVADRAGAALLDRDPFWDRLGQLLYENEEYRPKVPSWLYFRKLNMFNAAEYPRLFLDANALLLSAEPFRQDNRYLENVDFLFHSGAAKGRNFPAGAPFSGIFSPAAQNGFNLGHVAFTPSAARQITQFSRAFLDFARAEHRRFMGKSPEQSYLCYAIAFAHLKAALLSDLDADVAFTNNSSFKCRARRGWRVPIRGWTNDRPATDFAEAPRRRRGSTSGCQRHPLQRLRRTGGEASIADPGNVGRHMSDSGLRFLEKRA